MNSQNNNELLEENETAIHHKRRQSTQCNKNMRKAKKTWIWVIAAMIGVCCLVYYINRINEERLLQAKYEEAVLLTQQGSYQSAAMAFNEIKDSRDEEIYSFLKEHIESLCSQGKGKEAKQLISSVSNARLYQKKDFSEFSMEIDYLEANQMVSECDYIDAYNRYIELAEYKDSQQKAQEVFNQNKNAFYDYAVLIYTTKNPNSVAKAKGYFEKLGGYGESVEYLQKIGELKNDPEFRFESLTMSDKVYIWDYIDSGSGSTADTNARWLKMQREYGITEDHIWAIIVNSDVIKAVGNKRQYQKVNSSNISVYDATLSYGSGDVVVANTKNDLDSFLSRIQKGETVIDMLMAGRIAYVEEGTKVNIINNGIAATKVRILEGTYENSEGWTISEAIQKK